MTTAAFSINFARCDAPPPWLRRAIVLLTTGYLCAGAVCAAALLVFAVWTHLDVQRLRQQARGNNLPMEHAALPDLQAQAALDASRLNAIAARLAARFPTTGKLAALTTTLPARTWLTGAESRRDNRTLTIRAAYLIDPDHPYDLPTARWMNALKADPDFSRGLKRLTLQDSVRKTQGSMELFVFTLSAEWAPLS